MDVVHFRDLDSRPSERELEAVSEFHSSRKTVHVMRDHREHRAPMLAGMWGAKTKGLRVKGKKWLQRILKAAEDGNTKRHSVYKLRLTCNS